MIFGTYQLIKYTGINFSAEFALAFAISRPLRKPRFPLELAAAATLSKLIPSLTHIELSSLGAVLPSNARRAAHERASKSDRVGRSMKYALDSVDKYGASYMIGSRFVGVCIVLSLHEMLLLGVDVQPYLESWGYENVGNALGQWAGAVVLSSSFYPLSIASTAYLAPLLASVRSRIV